MKLAFATEWNWKFEPNDFGAFRKQTFGKDWSEKEAPCDLYVSLNASAVGTYDVRRITTSPTLSSFAPGIPLR